MKNKPFLYEMKATVKLVESNEQGTVKGRAEYETAENSYYVRYRAGDGRQVSQWIDESDLAAA